MSMKTKDEVRKSRNPSPSRYSRHPLPRERVAEPVRSGTQEEAIKYKNSGNEARKSLKTKDDERCKVQKRTQNEPKAIAGLVVTECN